MTRLQSTFDAKNPHPRLVAGNGRLSSPRAPVATPGLTVEMTSKKPEAPLLMARLTGAVRIWAFAASVICTGLSGQAQAYLQPAAGRALADSGTTEPSDSGTEAAPGEDEPQTGTDQPSNTPQDDEQVPGDGFGCPVHEPGPYPMLI